MSTSSKLWFGFGLLLFLLIGIGLFVAQRLATIEQALSTIMAVQEPATATTYDMSLNVSATSTAVLRHVALGEPAPRTLVGDQRIQFERLFTRYDRVARSRVSRGLAERIHLAYEEFAGLGDSLMMLSDQQRMHLASFTRAGEGLQGIFARDVHPHLDGRGRDGQRKLAEVAGLEASVAGVGNALDLYVHAPEAGRRARISAYAEEFRSGMQRFLGLHLSDEERAAAVPLRGAFAEYVARAQSAANDTDQLQAGLARFTIIATRLQMLVEQGIHSLARTDLFEAQQSARGAIHFGMIAVLVLLVAAIVIGSLTALPVTRSVVRSEQALRERMAELALTHRRKDEFLAMLGHELRNPLAPLRNSLQLLEADDNAVPGRVQRVHDVMRRQVLNMARLVDDLLDVSRVNQGKITLRREPVELGLALEQAGEDLRPLARDRGNPLEIRLPDQPVWVDADPTRLSQMLANLLHNAVQHSNPGGPITLELERSGREALVRVRDQGVGIPSEMLGRIFEPFTQLDGLPGRAHGGLGIGLTLVHRLAELHGGSVHAESAGPNRGSTFTLRLPRIAAPRPTPPAPPAPVPAGPGRRVLVVDDNRDSAASLGELLGLWGHEVHIEHDGPSALERATACEPDVVLLDIGLPGLDGHEVARRLRANPGGRGALLIALTGLGQEADRQRALAAGFDHHLAKPVDPEELRGLIARQPA